MIFITINDFHRRIIVFIVIVAMVINNKWREDVLWDQELMDFIFYPVFTI